MGHVRRDAEIRQHPVIQHRALKNLRCIVVQPGLLRWHEFSFAMQNTHKEEFILVTCGCQIPSKYHKRTWKDMFFSFLSFSHFFMVHTEHTDILHAIIFIALFNISQINDFLHRFVFDSFPKHTGTTLFSQLKKEFFCLSKHGLRF